GDSRPQIAYEFLRVIAGIDYAMVLSEQLFARVFRDFAKPFVNEFYDSGLIGYRNDRRFVQRELDIGEFFERAPQLLIVIACYDLFANHLKSRQLFVSAAHYR